MSDMRITSLMPQQQILEGLSTTMNTILKDQNQVATGIVLNAPSDNPGAVTQDLVVNHALSQVNSWSGVAQSALAVAQGTDQTLTQMESAANSAYTAGLSVLSGAAQTDAPAIVTELSGYMSSIGQLANTNVGGIYVVGGDSGNPPWSSSSPTTVSSGKAMSVQIGSSVSATQNMDGSQVVSGLLQGVNAVKTAVNAPETGQTYNVTVKFSYASGTSSTTSTTYTSTAPPGSLTIASPGGTPTGITATFAMGSTTVDQESVPLASYSSTTGSATFTAPTWSQIVGGALNELQTAQHSLISAHAQFGTEMQKIQAAQTTLASQSTQLSSTKATLDSAPIPNVIANLSSEEAAYQAILQSAQAVLQPTLANYLSKIG